ncbi:hypothetical protein GCM10023094_34410 [Rhodococcus olei]|uniref:Aconitase/3-isopropylmalate dehydratase large subunit alpha/beta/alpha domain-containing protein n=1 Tax=Rhodococcus olei TaxID=2161675 RepID=A0ABP8P9U0_9NOCA
MAGEPVGQVVIGSSANPVLRDFAIAAAMVAGRQTAPSVSFDINPSSREIFSDLTRTGGTLDLITADARIHQSGCTGCIGMGRAPATGRNPLRTMPRNFPGRSGTREDSVWLCSPETAAASTLTGAITDPRDWAEEMGMGCPQLRLPAAAAVNTAMTVAPLPGSRPPELEASRGHRAQASRMGDAPWVDRARSIVLAHQVCAESDGPMPRAVAVVASQRRRTPDAPSK